MIDFYNDFTMTIGGRSAVGSAQIDVVNPATEETIAKAPDAGRADLDEAVAAARRGFPAWRDAPIAARREAVAAFAMVLGTHAADFARLFTMEQGRPLAKAMEEVQASAFWCAQVAKQDIPVIVNEDSTERRSETHHVPLGVVAGIVPWNFPMMLGVWKIASALLTGNTIIVKPSPFTPLTMLKLGELMRDHLPPGVFSVVSGGDQLGPWLTEHPGIDKISFTGSTATGRRVMASAAASLKRVTLELGGNDPAIVLPDADINAIAERLFWGAFGNSGQICIAIKRLYVHADIYDAVARALADIAGRTVVGDGLTQGSALGPIQNKPQFDRVRALIADAKARGQAFITGGEVTEGKGYFVPVSIVDNPAEDSPVVTEEAFGPVLPMIKFDDVDDVIARANASEYGLGASVWSRDEGKAAEIAARLDAGTVWVNESAYVMPWTPFGGHKQSGIGTENGEAGLLEYTVPRTITVRKASASSDN